MSTVNNQNVNKKIYTTYKNSIFLLQHLNMIYADKCEKNP